MITLLLLAGCDSGQEIPFHFDGPIAGAALAPEDGPFDEAVGFVANQRSGMVIPLDLKMGRLLTDDATASFLHASAVPFGRARLLSDLAVVGGGDTVSLWSIDNAREQLLYAPYITSVDANGFPVEVEPTASDPTFVDADGSGDAPSMTAVRARAGWTTTEDWSIEFDGTRWWAKGSRSGVQDREPVAGELYHTDHDELEFQIDGGATAGDRFEVHTDSGVLEYTLDGPVTAVASANGLVFASVASPETPGVHVYDGLTGEWLGATWFAAGNAPGRIAVGPEGTLYVADTARPVVHAITLDLAAAPITGAATEILTSGPVQDLAYLAGEAQDGTPYEHLFLAPVGLQRVDVYDLAGGAWVDPNPVTPEEWGVALGAPISGLAPSLDQVWLQQPTSWGARQRDAVVAVTLATGYMLEIDGATGCLVADERGPHGPNELYDNTAASYEDVGESSDTKLFVDSSTGTVIVPSPCGGVTRSETWTVTYSSATLDWEVEGSLSGVQANRAQSDQRYVSDEGAVSFALLTGPRAPTDGDRFVFTMDAGLLIFSSSDTGGAATTSYTSWELPARPVPFETYNGPTGGGWDAVDRRQFMMVPVTNSDLVSLAWLDAGQEFAAIQ